VSDRGTPEVVSPDTCRRRGIDGYSDFDAWIVVPAGKKLNCSVVLRNFDWEFMREPYVSVLRLRCRKTGVCRDKR
jgi:hypothetical protein